MGRPRRRGRRFFRDYILDTTLRISKTPKEGLRAEPDIPPSLGNKAITPKAKKKFLDDARLIVEILTLSVVAFYTFYARQQSVEMRKATVAAQISADAAKRAATVAERTFNQNTGVASHTLEQMSKQTKAMQDNATHMKEMAALNRSALDITVKNAELAQRAWLSVGGLIPAYKEGDKAVFIKEGQPLDIGLTVKNSGSTPARNVKISTMMYDVDAKEKFIPNFRETHLVVFRKTKLLQRGALPPTSE